MAASGAESYFNGAACEEVQDRTGRSTRWYMNKHMIVYTEARCISEGPIANHVLVHEGKDGLLLFIRLCFSVPLSLCLSVSLFLFRSISPCLSVSLSPCLCFCLCLSASLPGSVSLAPWLPVSLSLFMSLSLCLSLCLFVSLSLSLGLSVSQSLRMSLAMRTIFLFQRAPIFSKEAGAEAPFLAISLSHTLHHSPILYHSLTLSL